MKTPCIYGLGYNGLPPVFIAVPTPLVNCPRVADLNITQERI
jgi:hypothetical protein